jgi:hypothetical protein
MPDVNQGWVALFGTLFGASGLKLIEAWLNKPKERRDDEAEFRKELRSDVTELRNELRKVENELDMWREKYYTLMDEFVKFKSTHTDPKG